MFVCAVLLIVLRTQLCVMNSETTSLATSQSLSPSPSISVLSAGSPSLPSVHSPLLTTLQSFFSLCRTLLLFNDVQLFEFMLTEENIDMTVRMLEYEPAIGRDRRVAKDWKTHRTFLAE